MKSCPSCGLKYRDEQDRCFVDGATLQQEADPYIGTTIAGRYQIESVVGEGGMATVYRARHTLVDRPVAVKIMSRHLADSGSLRERFRREAKNAAQLAHPNIIEIYDFGDTEDGAPFLVMELLEGVPLSDHIASGPMRPGDVAILGLQIAEGLCRAHDFDVIHRDLKPDNIFLAMQGPESVQAKLLDFGIARSMHDSRLTNAGEIFGTPQYMAPERVTSIDAGPSADLYALGVILFEMLTGRTPFISEEVTGYFIKHMQDAPPNPSDLVPQCPRRLEALILGLLAKKPSERPVDAHQVIAELQTLVPKGSAPSIVPMATPTQLPPPTLPPATLDRWSKRADIFNEMLQLAFPSGAPPRPANQLAKIQKCLSDANKIRSKGLVEQRKVEELEQAARDRRARLGHAVHTIGEDLSKARKAERQASAEVAPYFDRANEAKKLYESCHRKFVAQGGTKVQQAPMPAFVKATRELADTLDKWSLAQSAADKAHEWVDAKAGEVKDLEFQLDMLRKQLAKQETDFDSHRTGSESLLVEGNKEAIRLENQLVVLSSEFCEMLRERRELRDLFTKLERE